MHAFLTPKQIVWGAVVVFLSGVVAPATANDGPIATAPRAGITPEVEGFADTTSMTPAAKRLYLDARPTVEDATGLTAACPAPARAGTVPARLRRPARADPSAAHRAAGPERQDARDRRPRDAAPRLRAPGAA